jgi:pyruvate dehydrogenase E2 component (dihydrolipoamide acetyltransferase)
VERAEAEGVAKAPSAPAAGAPEAPVYIAAPLKDQTQPVSGKRRIIAQRLAESKYSAPHFYLKMPVFTETLMGARKSLNAGLSYKVSVNAFLIKFAAEAIKRHPVINSSWEGDTIRQFGSIDIGLAVAQEDGLVTPIVRNCGGKGIVQIDQELSELIERARNNKLTPEDYTGATFTISSLGTFGVEEFTAIINPPGSAILAVGQMQKVPVVGENDEIAVRMQMKLTLSCDHRIIDGAKGARFLEELKNIIEHPVRALY